MKSSTSMAMGRGASLALVLLGALAITGCKGDRPGAGAAGSAASPLAMTVQVAPPDVNNRRAASVRFQATAPLPDGQLSFELPKECQIVAGAAVRPVKNLGNGNSPSPSQELTFQCPPGTPGVLKATFKGTDPAGQPLEQSVEGSLQ